MEFTQQTVFTHKRALPDMPGSKTLEVYDGGTVDGTTVATMQPISTGGRVIP